MLVFSLSLLLFLRAIVKCYESTILRKISRFGPQKRGIKMQQHLVVVRLLGSSDESLVQQDFV